MGCPCQSEGPPILRLRGYCPRTHLDTTFISKQLHAQVGITYVGKISSQVHYDKSNSLWFLSDAAYNITATSEATLESYILGKHNWTVTGDNKRCSKGQTYTRQMKLTGCTDEEFTCDDGQCIRMEKRCNQLPNCRDKSDERNCNILILESGYNREVPPITSVSSTDDTIIPVPVKVSINLLKVVLIEEEEHAIELQFQIIQDWKDNRASYQNLKEEPTLNALREAVASPGYL